MRAVDLIAKKRDGGSLNQREIAFLVDGYVAAEIPEYQISSWLMAVFFRGMSGEETGFLTDAMIRSGTVFDLSGVPGPFVDKHSTGGVGDKVSLILAPIVAACGVRVPMMSGRALGHTGGTLDKLESMPGFSTALSSEQFRALLNDVGFAMTGQSKDVVPADRLLYALRDVTATVESVPLITASILSKKFAEGADALVFDVKCGPGAFMKTEADTRRLAESLVNTGSALGKKIVAVLTRMEEPLGHMVGNFLEVEESIACLHGSIGGRSLSPDPRSADLMEVTRRLSAWMLVLGGVAATVDEATARVDGVLEDGSAWARFVRNVEGQGSSMEEVEKRYGTWRAPICERVPVPRAGVIHAIDAFAVGMAGVYLGVGRNTAADPVHPDVGIEFHRKRGDVVSADEALCTIYGHTAEAVASAREQITGACEIADTPWKPHPIVFDEISNLE
ncbi:MAG: thymidine phosphorylase [Spirochaetaceae bacterium]|nr:MAG: thymidine phosphorylase [Spirochaetaceae bacterium]